MKVFVTGGAGFIGSHLSERLIEKGYSVTIYDNFSSGKKNFLTTILPSKKLRIIQADVLDPKRLGQEIAGHEIVYHLSANPDVRKGALDTRFDFEQNTVATYNVLEAMRQCRVSKIVFPSSMTVYGKAEGIISESYGPCLPISLYAAGKLACEGMISAFCETFRFQAWILRFANIIGGRATHGVIYDLINKLLRNNKELEVLGDGKQDKPYIYIGDALDAMDFVVSHAKSNVNLFNVGTTDTIQVSHIAKIIIDKMGLKNIKIRYTGTPYGWKGDVPAFRLHIGRLARLGFKPHYFSSQAVEQTVDALLAETGYTK